MTITTLKEFINFCIEIYENRKELLLEKWNAHKDYILPGGICEMSLLYLWIRETRLRVKNIGLRDDNKLPVIVGNGIGRSGINEIYELKKN